MSDIKNLPPIPPLTKEEIEHLNRLRQVVDAYIISCLDDKQFQSGDVLTFLMTSFFRWCRYFKVDKNSVMEPLQANLNKLSEDSFAISESVIQSQFEEADALAAIISTYLRQFNLNTRGPEANVNVEPTEPTKKTNLN